MKHFAYATALSIALVVAANSSRAGEFDGAWSAGGGPETGTERWCGSWQMRLDIAQGRPTGGVVSVMRGNTTLENIVLLPDGSFTATARGGGIGTSQLEMKAYEVKGKLSGDQIVATLTMTSDPRCGTRTGKGTRLKT